MSYYEDKCEDLKFENEMLHKRVEMLEQALRDSGDADMISDINCRLNEEFGIDEPEGDEVICPVCESVMLIPDDLDYEEEMTDDGHKWKLSMDRFTCDSCGTLYEHHLHFEPCQTKENRILQVYRLIGEYLAVVKDEDEGSIEDTYPVEHKDY